MTKTTNAAANCEFDKEQCAHQTPRTFGWVKATYPEAIEYTAGPPGMRGLMLFMGIFVLAVMLVIGVFSVVYPETPFVSDYV